MNPVRIFIEYRKQVLQFPVNPEEFATPVEADTESISLVGTGNIELPKKRNPKEIEINSFFPADDDAPYVEVKGVFHPPKTFIAFIELIMEEAKPCRIIVTEYGINMLMSVTKFEPKRTFGTNDVPFELTLVEYHNPRARILKPVKQQDGTTKTVSKTATTRPKTGFSVGDDVIANGKYWYDSYGSPPNGTFKNFAGKISKIVADKKRKYRYHITTPQGGWRGWVAESQIKHK